jgi:GNAT superfamily N-acetyltransferase
MIRRATFDDAKALIQLIREQHAASKYAGRCPIAEPALANLVTNMIAQQGQIGPQGSAVFVAERDGKVVGFLAGVLDRVYQIGKKLAAQDLFFVNNGTVGDTMALLDAYVAWAVSIRAVLEIVVSWSDTLPGAEKVAKLYERKGFSKCGELYEMRTDAEAVGEAA